jgi:hypothetical protein
LKSSEALVIPVASPVADPREEKLKVALLEDPKILEEDPEPNKLALALEAGC